MTHSEIKPPHVLFLFSDTGGGHRSAAEAISDAHLHLRINSRDAQFYAQRGYFVNQSRTRHDQ